MVYQYINYLQNMLCIILEKWEKKKKQKKKTYIWVVIENELF